LLTFSTVKLFCLTVENVTQLYDVCVRKSIRKSDHVFESYERFLAPFTSSLKSVKDRLKLTAVIL
jgi:hypothetical protein